MSKLDERMSKNSIIKFKKFIDAHGFAPWEEECGVCGRPRYMHAPRRRSAKCVFERTGKKSSYRNIDGMPQLECSQCHERMWDRKDKKTSLCRHCYNASDLNKHGNKPR
jgi:hypothetical protein